MTTDPASAPGGWYGRNFSVDDSKRQQIEPIDWSVVGPYRAVRIKNLITKWRAETCYASSVSEKIKNPEFKEIVEMGDSAVPYIISELKTAPDFLFMALHLITGIDPTPDSAKGKPREMIEAWLLWAEREKIGKDATPIP